MLGSLIHGALWLAVVGLVAIIVVIALIVAAVRRAAGRVAAPHTHELRHPREDDYRALSGTTSPESHEMTHNMGRYEGGDVRTTTETATSTTDGAPTIRTNETDERAR